MTFPSYPATEQQQRIVSLAGELADTFLKRANEREWSGDFPYENYQDLHNSGYLALTVPRDFGGWGASVVDVMLGQARLAQGCPSTALVMGMHLSNIGRIVAGLSEPNPLFERICRSVVEDGAVINSAATEPGTGSPSRGGKPATTATRQPDGSWLINGRKTFTTGSLVLHYFIVSCSLEDAPETTGLPPLTSERGGFVIPRDSPGLRIEETWNTVAMRLTASHDLVLENVHVGPELSASGLESFTPAAQTRLGAWGFPTTAVYLGIAQGARNEAVRFAGRRRPNSLDNTSIASVPHIQDKVAKMDLALLQSEAVLFGIAEQFLKEPGSIPASQFAAAKYLVSNHAVEVTELAMRLVGGASLSLSLPLQRYYRDVRAGLHHPPMDDATFALLSKQAFS